MTRLAFLALAAASVPTLTIAQSPTPAFEVATIRPSQSGSRELDITRGNLIFRNAPLLDIVAFAYGVQNVQVSGPSWLPTARFEIVAKAPAPASRDEMRAMLQTLLAERFKLTIHCEMKEMSALVITVGKNGHKLQENSVEGSPSFTTGPLRLNGNGATLRQMTDFISREIGVLVVDRTGLKGRYNYKVDINAFVTPEMRRAGGPPIEAPFIVSQALREQLGFAVDSSKVPIEIVVIDRIEKEPTEN
jgi:uncharacterized protein (TIGR03435 family)